MESDQIRGENMKEANLQNNNQIPTLSYYANPSFPQRFILDGSQSLVSMFLLYLQLKLGVSISFTGYHVNEAGPRPRPQWPTCQSSARCNVHILLPDSQSTSVLLVSH